MKKIVPKGVCMFLNVENVSVLLGMHLIARKDMCL